MKMPRLSLPPPIVKTPGVWIPDKVQLDLDKTLVAPTEIQKQIDALPTLEWWSADYWKREAVFWKTQQEMDLVFYCSFLAEQWKRFNCVTDRNIYMLRGRVSSVVYAACKERRELAEAGLLHPERKDTAYYILGWLYRQKFPNPGLPSKKSAEEYPDYSSALESAKAASWKAVGKDCEKFWEEHCGNLMIQGGVLNNKKAPSLRIRRQNAFLERPSAFVSGNWIRCHLWLMTPDVRLSFVRLHGFPAMELDALTKIVKRAKLYCRPSPPITRIIKKTGELLFSESGQN